jgi:anti-anti-sigma regulatory factor
VAESDEAAATVVVVITGDQVVVSRLDGRIDLALVDRLARLTLEAWRRGAAVRLHDPPPELRQLLELCGLSDVLP